MTAEYLGRGGRGVKFTTSSKFGEHGECIREVGKSAEAISPLPSSAFYVVRGH